MGNVWNCNQKRENIENEWLGNENVILMGEVEFLGICGVLVMY